jgi:hypothetical protein
MERVELEPRVARTRASAPPFGISFERLLSIVAVLLPVVVALRFSMSTVDLAYGIRAGARMLDAHSLLRTDTFTFTVAGRSWLNQQWLGQIAFAWLYRLGGWELIAVVRAALAGAIFWIVFLACRERGASTRSSAWLTIGALAVSTYGLVPRPQLLAVVLFAAALWLIARRERSPRALWLLPLLVVVWANVHGSFFLIPMLLAGTWLEDRTHRRELARTELAVIGACLLGTLVNPFGVRVWPYVVSLSTNPDVRDTISEWRPPSPTTFTGVFFFLSLAAVTFLVWRARARLPLARIVTLAAFAVIGLLAVRGIVWWTLAAPVLIADVMPRSADTREVRRPLNVAFIAVLVALAMVWSPWSRPLYASTANSLTTADGLLAFAPAAYSTRLAASASPGERVFVPEAWASWFELEVPDVRPMVDARIEIFPTTVWDDYDAISRAAPGWERIVDRWGMRTLVLSTLQQQPLIDAIDEDPRGWTEVYRDADGMIVTRSS